MSRFCGPAKRVGECRSTVRNIDQKDMRERAVKSYWETTLSNRVSRRRALALTGAAAASAAILAACGSDDGGTESGPQTQTEAGSTNKSEGTFTRQEGSPVAGGTYRVALAGSANFNPVTNYTEGASLGGIYVYDRPLSSREDTRRYVLEALASLELADPLKLVMKLKPGMVYQNIAPVNGRAVEASDIVATQEYVKVTPNAFDKTFVNSYLDRAEAIDKETVVYHLKRPAAYLFGGQLLGSGTSQPIVPKETLPTLTEGTQVGSGAFMVDSQRRDVTYTYKQNPTFRGRKDGNPYINGVEITFLADKAAQEAAFYGDKLDYFVPSPAQMRTAKSRLPNAQFFSQAGFNTTNFSLNMWKERALPWQDIRIRQAIWMLTDRNDLLTRGYEGAGELPTGLLPVSLKPYQVDAKDSAQYMKLDIAEAKKLLAAANWDESKEYGIMGRGFGDILESVALVQQANLAKGGVKTTIQPIQGSEFFARLTAKDWDMMFETPPGDDVPGRQIRVQHSDSWSDQYRGFALFDKELDALIEKSESETDYEANRKLVIDVQKLAMSKYTSAVTAVSHYTLFILGPKVQNYELTMVPVAPRHTMWLKT